MSPKSREVSLARARYEAEKWVRDIPSIGRVWHMQGLERPSSSWGLQLTATNGTGTSTYIPQERNSAAIGWTWKWILLQSLRKEHGLTNTLILKPAKSVPRLLTHGNCQICDNFYGCKGKLIHLSTSGVTIFHLISDNFPYSILQ